MKRSKIALICKIQINIQVQISRTFKVVSVTSFDYHEAWYVFVIIKFYCSGNFLRAQNYFPDIRHFFCLFVVRDDKAKWLRKWGFPVREPRI